MKREAGISEQRHHHNSREVEYGEGRGGRGRRELSVSKVGKNEAFGAGGGRGVDVFLSKGGEKGVADSWTAMVLMRGTAERREPPVEERRGGREK